MRSRRAVPALFFLILATVLLGSGVASARPAQNRVPALDLATPTMTPAGHDGGRHCRTRRDPVMPDPTDV